MSLKANIGSNVNVPTYCDRLQDYTSSVKYMSIATCGTSLAFQITVLDKIKQVDFGTFLHF